MDKPPEVKFPLKVKTLDYCQYKYPKMLAILKYSKYQTGLFGFRKPIKLATFKNNSDYTDTVQSYY